ncbi:hypothetical protein IPJ91_00700 [bacterium]|nr:MAG: hypothetical protein IPJ91_00700 [bacterium]
MKRERFPVGHFSLKKPDFFILGKFRELTISLRNLSQSQKVSLKILTFVIILFLAVIVLFNQFSSKNIVSKLELSNPFTTRNQIIPGNSFRVAVIIFEQSDDSRIATKFFISKFDPKEQSIVTLNFTDALDSSNPDLFAAKSLYEFENLIREKLSLYIDRIIVIEPSSYQSSELMDLSPKEFWHILDRKFKNMTNIVNYIQAFNSDMQTNLSVEEFYEAQRIVGYNLFSTIDANLSIQSDLDNRFLSDDISKEQARVEIVNSSDKGGLAQYYAGLLANSGVFVSKIGNFDYSFERNVLYVEDVENYQSTITLISNILPDLEIRKQSLNGLTTSDMLLIVRK